MEIEVEIFGSGTEGLADKCGEYRKEKPPLLIDFWLER